MNNFATGHTDRNGFEQWISVNPSTRINAKPSQIPGDIVLTLGSGTGSGLVLVLGEREADQVIDVLVDALEGARMRASEREASNARND